MIVEHSDYDIPEGTPDRVLQVIEELQRLELMKELLLERLDTYLSYEADDTDVDDLIYQVYRCYK